MRSWILRRCRSAEGDRDNDVANLPGMWPRPDNDSDPQRLRGGVRMWSRLVLRAWVGPVHRMSGTFDVPWKYGDTACARRVPRGIPAG